MVKGRKKKVVTDMIQKEKQGVTKPAKQERKDPKDDAVACLRNEGLNAFVEDGVVFVRQFDMDAEFLYNRVKALLDSIGYRASFGICAKRQPKSIFVSN